MPYEVYVNHPRNKAIVHDSTCAYLRMHGGVSTTNPPTGHYSCVLQDLDAAWAFAFATNKRGNAYIHGMPRLFDAS